MGLVLVEGMLVIPSACYGEVSDHAPCELAHRHGNVEALHHAIPRFFRGFWYPRALLGQWRRTAAYQLCPKQAELLSAGFALYCPLDVLDLGFR